MLFRIIAATLLALMLSACGGTPPPAAGQAQVFIRQHTECQTASYSDPQWSPDGALIYYSMWSPGSPTWDVRVMSSNGSNDRLLAHNVDQQQLSPDGTMLLFPRPSSKGVQAYDYYLLDVTSTQIRRVIEEGNAVAWSPDSQWVVYATPPRVKRPLRKTDVSTGEIVQLTDTTPGTPYVEINPMWSPDGRQIAFATIQDAGGSTVTLINADGSDRRQLTPKQDPQCTASLAANESPAGWSPDGNLAVNRGCDAGSTLRVITPDGAELADWSSVHTNTSFVRWSPDGRQILFNAFSSGGGTVFNVANRDGSDLKVLTAGGSYGASWSPDGRRIVFSTIDPAGIMEMFIVNADGSGLTQITQNPGAGQLCLH